MTGPIIRTCSPDPEGRAEILCELRTEKPWQGDEGPEFNSRQLHPGPREIGGLFLCNYFPIRESSPAALREGYLAVDSELSIYMA